MTKIIFIVLLLGVSLESHGSTTEKNISCRGNLLINGVKKDHSVKTLNSDATGFNSTNNEFSYFYIGPDSANRFIEIYPWHDIRQTKYPEHYRNNFIIDFETDKKSFFKITIIGKKTKYSESIKCKIFLQ